METDDFSGKLNELFSNPENMEKIKALVGMLSGGQNPAGETPPNTGPAAAAPAPQPDGPAQAADNADPGRPNQTGTGGNGNLGFDPNMLLKIQQAMNLMKKDDPRIDLLLALKPNLNPARQKRVDEAIHIMRLINIMPLLREQGFLWGDG